MIEVNLMNPKQDPQCWEGRRVYHIWNRLQTEGGQVVAVLTVRCHRDRDVAYRRKLGMWQRADR